MLGNQTSYGDAYPCFSDYEKWYARYLAGDRSRQMVDLAGHLNGLNVLDLCGGGGRISRLCLLRGAHAVCLVDQSDEMMLGTQDLLEVDRFRTITASIRDYLKANVEEGWPDLIFCQQAINYWLDEEAASLLAQNMKSGARFIFNTFNVCPPSLPVPKQYDFNGQSFIELSWTVPEGSRLRIEHIQICEGCPPHRTCFYWISPEEYQAWLSPYFHIKMQKDGATTLYCLERKA